MAVTSKAGEIMALQAHGSPAWGVQFHPESLLSAHGRTLLGNWLELSAGWAGGPGHAAAAP
ncbi:MAG: glutamine amidotransferase-related protein [Deinococcus sp.]